VPDGAAVCPHADCGKPLAAGNKKRPPPPGPVRLTNTDARHPQPAVASSPRGETRTSWRGVLATLMLLLLLVLLVGGVYYAAVGQKPEEAARLDQPPRQTEAGKPRPEVESSKPKEDAAPPKADATVVPTTTTDEEPKPTGQEANVAAQAAVPGAPAEPLGLYGERTRADRETWIGEVGGTPESELGVAGGLEWLARHQADDGHWGPDCLGPGGLCCEREHPCSGNGQKFEAALTGLAVLAFQAGGHYDFNDHPYSDRVRRGLDWLVARQGPNGEIVGSLSVIEAQGGVVRYDDRFMYEHAIATFALAESCAVARAAQRHLDERYLGAALRAVRFIEAQQHEDGGWRYHPIKSEPSDASVSGWAMLALKTAVEADLPVDKQVLSRMVAFFKKLEDPLTGRTHYQLNSYGTEALTGVGMMVDEFVLKRRDSELVPLAAPHLADVASTQWGEGRNGASDFYLWYNCTLAMFQAGGDPWKRWNDVVRDRVLALQLHGSDCVRGSWEPQSQWGGYGGRIYTTALAVLTLEVYYRFARDAGENPATQK
jgi:hypothetical protein